METKKQQPPATKTPAELEIRLRLTKEQVIYELQIMVAYSKTISDVEFKGMCQILTCTDLDEIAEERAALGRCNSPVCLNPVKVPKVAPKYQLGEDKIEKFSGKYYCCDRCEKAYQKLSDFAKANVQSHQLTDVAHYYALCDQWKASIPRLASLKSEIQSLAAQYEKAVTASKEKPKPEQKSKAAFPI